MVLSTGVLVFFFLTVLGALLLSCKRELFGQLKFSITSNETKMFVAILAGISITLAALLQFLAEDAIPNVALFAVAFSLPFFLRRVNLPYQLLKLLFLVAAVLSVSFVSPHFSNLAPMCILLGLLVYKTTDSFLFSGENRLDDILPACLWLALTFWGFLTARNSGNIENILLSCLSISLLLKMLPSSLIGNDQFFAKRIALSVSGGLLLLLILTRVLLLPKMALFAALFGAGIFFFYLFENLVLSELDISKLSVCTKFLVLLGILTLVATRLFGDRGLLVLSCASLVCSSSNIALIAGFFWISRLLLQAFVLTYVDNVTGINLMHAYASAAQYFGFLTVLFLSIVLQINKRKWVTPLMIGSAGILVPPTLMYFIHQEPAASFLVAVNVAAISITSFSPLIFKDKDARQDNLMLLPLIMLATALLSGPLVVSGNMATVTSRFQLVLGVSVVLLFICLVFFLLEFSKRRQKA